MQNIFENYGIQLNKEQSEKFENYYKLLVYFNEKFNITAITDKEEVYKKHFVDSLLGKNMFISGKLIDVGSGGGFPAIPNKIVNDELDIIMLEATGKKCEFLNTVIMELDLKNIIVINGRAEDFSKKEEYREKFDYASARAVAGLNILSEYCLPFVKKGGHFIAFKGQAEEEIINSKKAIDILGGKIDNVYEFSLEGAKREIIDIVKIKNTPSLYPRSNAKIRKSPI
ncbi:MAG: 16S rRNA (guanine(527)-N(7))-methyltransferase RsmG [Clostridia bacterium]|nr:16S rRNA (guanine(527)-N(7))-methyltransferase RsmG [Clostridia bacterium]